VGVAAAFVFWLYLRQPSWLRAGAAGFLLGLAQLTKFSMLLLDAVWPFLWLVRLLLTTPRPGLPSRAAAGIAHGLLIVALSILTIDAGYLFEGVGTPLGRFEFGCRTLTKSVAGGIRTPPATTNPAYAMLWPFVENRFRGTILERVPMPLPEHYLLGFDEQKIEAEGFPNRLTRAYGALNEALRKRAANRANEGPGSNRLTQAHDALNQDDLAKVRAELNSGDDSVAGYPVYLNGELRRSGWWYYYLCTLLYKVPEGTWLLVALSLLVLMLRRHPPESWSDEACLWTIPAVVLFSMSFLTNINLGLRYILPIFPYVFIAAGKVVPWMEGLSGLRRWVARSFVAASLGLSIAATAWIHPHYLAYFNWASGGPDRVPVRLIDSNLDWGQDLVGLREWCREHAPDQPIGLAYFGQINPSIFTLRGDRFDWFLPPVLPGTIRPMDRNPGLPPRLIGPAARLSPGYYAISATLVHGLPWRLYDSAPDPWDAWEPAWNASEEAFGYFRRLFQPIARIGHSIYVYKLSPEDVARAEPLLRPRRVTGSGRLPAHVDLRQVVLPGWTEVDGHLESRRAEDVREILAELGEDGIPHVPAGVADQRGAIVERAIRVDHDSRVGLLGTRQERHGANVESAGSEDPVDFLEGRVEVGHVLERLGGQDEIEARVGIGQAGQVLGADSIDDRTGLGARLVVGGLEGG
jgi:hypothetical protein